ncbi:MAG: ABC transporter permease subunit [Acidobacteriia bacterium]|nr:ABC transporter permease subunit [Terriglobia bacterium]
MTKILAIAQNTFKEAIRDKILYSLILFALLMIGSSILLGMISINIETKVTIDVGLSAMSVIGAVMAVFIGINLVHKEIDKKTLYSILSKPIHRTQFILGKFLGLGFTLLVNLVIMAVGLVGVLMFISRGTGGIHSSLFIAVFLIFLQLLLITGIALVFSSFSTPALSAMFTLALYFIGQFNADIRHFGTAANSLAIQSVTTSLYYLLPNFGNFNVIAGVSHGRPIAWTLLGYDLIYSIAYLFILLSASAVIFGRRDLK